ncbi:hypothetical protein ACROYT_G044637 [Oculina patagonica]
MAILVRTCCCGCDLRTGILLIGILGLLSSGYGIYSSFDAYKTLTRIENGPQQTLEKLPVAYKYFKVVINLSIASIAFRAISTLANLLLLGSYGTLNRFLAMPWFFWEIFMVLYTFGLTIFLMTIWNGFATVFVVNILGWLLTIYFVIVVYSYIENLRQDPSAFETGIVMQPPPYAKFP